MSEWQPIETAPKDGSRIHLGFAHMRGFDVIGFWADGDWADSGFPGDWQRFHGRPAPTHWMPLPDPPRASTFRPFGIEAVRAALANAAPAQVESGKRLLDAITNQLLEGETATALVPSRKARLELCAEACRAFNQATKGDGQS